MAEGICLRLIERNEELHTLILRPLRDPSSTSEVTIGSGTTQFWICPTNTARSPREESAV